MDCYTEEFSKKATFHKHFYLLSERIFLVVLRRVVLYCLMKMEVEFTVFFVFALKQLMDFAAYAKILNCNEAATGDVELTGQFCQDSGDESM